MALPIHEWLKQKDYSASRSQRRSMDRSAANLRMLQARRLGQVPPPAEAMAPPPEITQPVQAKPAGLTPEITPAIAPPVAPAPPVPARPEPTDPISEILGGKTMYTATPEESKRIISRIKQLPKSLQNAAIDQYETGAVSPEESTDAFEHMFKVRTDTRPDEIEVDPSGLTRAVEYYMEEVIPRAGFYGLYGIQKTLLPFTKQELERKYDEKRRAGMSRMQASMEAYRESDLPWGVKGAAELVFDPLNLIPGIGFTGKGTIRGLSKLVGIRSAFLKEALAEEALMAQLPRTVTAVGYKKYWGELPRLRPVGGGAFIDEGDVAKLHTTVGPETSSEMMYRVGSKANTFDEKMALARASGDILENSIIQNKQPLRAGLNEAGDITDELPAAIKEAEEWAAAMVDRLIPSKLMEWILHVPVLRKLPEALTPALKLWRLDKKDKTIWKAWVARDSVRKSFQTEAEASFMPIMNMLDSAFGKGATYGNKVDNYIFTGTKQQEWKHVGTLKDIMDRTDLYELTPQQYDALREFQRRNDLLLSLANQYGVDLKPFVNKQGYYVPTSMKGSDAAKELLEVNKDIIGARHFKHREYETAFDRWSAMDAAQQQGTDIVLDIRSLIRNVDSMKASNASEATWLKLAGGKTKSELIQRLHPELFEARKLLTNKVAGLRTRMKNVLIANQAKGATVRHVSDTRKNLTEQIEELQKEIDKIDQLVTDEKTGLKNQYAEGGLGAFGKDIHILTDELLDLSRQMVSGLDDSVVTVEQALKAGQKKATSLQTELEEAFTQLKEVRKLYQDLDITLAKINPKTGKTERWKFVKLAANGKGAYVEGVEQANALKQLTKVSDSGFFHFLENTRKTIFVGDLSPIVGVQAPLQWFAAPFRTTEDWIKGAGRGIRHKDPFAAFRSGQIAKDMADPAVREQWRKFSFFTGISRGQTADEFSTGYLGKIGWGIGKKITETNEAMFNAVLRETFNGWRNMSDNLIQGGMDPIQAYATAADLATKINPIWNPAAMGLSEARALKMRSLVTSVSFIRRPAELTRDATVGFMKLIGSFAAGPDAPRLWLTPKEKYSMRIAMNIGMSTMGISVTSAIMNETERGNINWDVDVTSERDRDRLTKQVVDAIGPVVNPESGKFMSIVFGDRRISLGGPYRSIIKAIAPRKEFRLMGDEKFVAPVPIPFAGVPDFFFNRITPVLKPATEIFLKGEDFYGNKIIDKSGNFGWQILDAMAHQVMGSVPLTAGEAMRGVYHNYRRGAQNSAWDIVEQSGTQFLGVNEFRDTAYQRRNAVVKTWARENNVENVETYYDLPPSKRKAFDQANPEVVEGIKKEVERRAKLGKEDAMRSVAAEDTKDEYRKQQLGDDEKFNNGEMSPNDWIDRKNARMRDLNISRDHLYAGGVNTDRPKTATDLYYQELDRLEEVANGQMTRDTWRLLEDWVEKQSAADRKYIEENTQLTSLTPTIGEYKEAQKILRPYWDVLDDVLDAFYGSRELYNEYNKLGSYQQSLFLRQPQNYILNLALTELERRRSFMRVNYVDIDSALVKWYGRKPKNPNNIFMQR